MTGPPDVSKLPSTLERVLECKQGAVRAVRFNGEPQFIDVGVSLEIIN